MKLRPTTLLTLLLPLTTLLVLPIHAQRGYEQRIWELRVTDEFDAGQPLFATVRFLDELYVSESAERRLAVLKRFQRILSERSDHFPADSVDNYDTKWEMEILINAFYTLELPEEPNLKAIEGLIADVLLIAKMETFDRATADELIDQNPAAYYALEALHLLLPASPTADWQAEVEARLQRHRPAAAYELVVQTILAAEGQTAKINILEEAMALFQDARESALPTDGVRTKQHAFFHEGVSLNYMELLEFEFDTSGRITNAERLQGRVVHGAAPRTDVPSLQDIKQPSVVQTLRILEAITGKPDPILSHARNKARFDPTYY